MKAHHSPTSSETVQGFKELQDMLRDHMETYSTTPGRKSVSTKGPDMHNLWN